MSAFTERLVKQMLKLKEVELAFETEKSSLAAKEKREADLEKEIAEAEEQLAKVEALRANFEALNAQAEAQHQEAKKKDQEERTAISQGLTAKIEEVNKMAADLGKAEIAAEQERQKYQRQLEIYSQHSSADDKLKNIKETRDEEFKRLQEKQERDMARVPESQKLLTIETEALESLRASHAQVKAKVDGYVARFADIQSLLDKSKKLYEDAKSEKERTQRTIKKLEEDRTHAVSRAKTSQTERKREFERMRALEDKMATLTAQHEKLQSLLDFLEGKEPATQSASASTTDCGRTEKDVTQTPKDSDVADEAFVLRAAAEPIVEDDDISESDGPDDSKAN